jgi:thiol-disulfide isomerase/thioredoxin
MTRQSSLAVLLALVAPLLAQESSTPTKPAASKQDGDKKAAAPAALKIGDAVPADLQLHDADGKAFAFKDHKGKVVAIHFWSVTCPWEKHAEPKLNQLATDYKGKDVVLVAINANANEIGDAPDAAAFQAKEDKDKPYHGLRKHIGKVNHTVLFDHTGDVARTFGAKTTPHCFVIDKEGKLAYAGGLDSDGKSSEVEASGQYVRLAIDATLAGKKVETPTAEAYG